MRREVRWEEVPARGGGVRGGGGGARGRLSRGRPAARPPRGPLPLLPGGRGGAGSQGLLAAPRPLHSGRALLAAAGAGPGRRRRR